MTDHIPAHIPSVLEDPSSRQIARVYAEAFLRATNDEADIALAELTSFHDDLLKPRPEFARLLTSGQLRGEALLGVIERVVAPVATAKLTNFLRVLARHGRLDLLPQILREAHLAREQAGGKRRVEVTSAVPLSSERQNEVRERLRGSLPFEPILIPKVDPRLLGGLVIQVGDTVYDNSVRSRLTQLRARLRQRSLHEIQSGRDRQRYSEGN